MQIYALFRKTANCSRHKSLCNTSIRLYGSPLLTRIARVVTMLGSVTTNSTRVASLVEIRCVDGAIGITVRLVTLAITVGTSLARRDSRRAAA